MQKSVRAPCPSRAIAKWTRDSEPPAAMPTAASRLMPTLRRVVLAGAGADRTDGQLLGAFVSNRDADAFAGLVRRHGPMVLGVCRRVTGDHADADDAFQAVFIVLARRAGGGQAARAGRQLAVRGGVPDGAEGPDGPGPPPVPREAGGRHARADQFRHPIAAEWTDLQPVIDEELARLPDKLRLPVVLCDLEGRAAARRGETSWHTPRDPRDAAGLGPPHAGDAAHPARRHALGRGAGGVARRSWHGRGCSARAGSRCRAGRGSGRRRWSRFRLSCPHTPSNFPKG